MNTQIKTSAHCRNDQPGGMISLGDNATPLQPLFDCVRGAEEWNRSASATVQRGADRDLGPSSRPVGMQLAKGRRSGCRRAAGLDPPAGPSARQPRPRGSEDACRLQASCHLQGHSALHLIGGAQLIADRGGHQKI